VIFFNTGSNPVSVNLGGSGVAAVATDNIVAAGGALPLTIGSNTYFAVWGVGGASTVVASGGTGLATGWGGGGIGTGGAPLSVVETYNNLATNQVSVGATATLIVAARTGRKNVTIFQEGSVLVRVGASGVTTATGVPLVGVQGSNIIIEGGQAIYGIVAAGTQTVSFMEVY
jgi:hypothetical protein